MRDFNILIFYVMLCKNNCEEICEGGFNFLTPDRLNVLANLLPVLSTREMSRSLICLDLSPHYKLLIISIIE